MKFSKREAIDFGWKIVKKNIKFYFPILLLVFWVNFGLGPIANFVVKKNFLGFFLLQILSGILSIIFHLGLIKISLKFCDNEKPKFSDLFSQYHLFFRYFFASIFLGLIIFIAISLFLIIPGIISSIKFGFYIFYHIGSILGPISFFIPILLAICISIRFSFYGYLIVDKNSRAIESLKKSWQITKGNTINLFLFVVSLVLINILGFLALLIGLFLTFPATILAIAFAYRKLLSFSESLQKGKLDNF